MSMGINPFDLCGITKIVWNQASLLLRIATDCVLLVLWGGAYLLNNPLELNESIYSVRITELIFII